MRIGISAPIKVDWLRRHLTIPDDHALPIGFGGAPSTIVTLGLLARGHHLVVVTLDSTVERPTVFHGDKLELHVVPSRVHGRGRDYFRAERRHIRDAFRAASSVDVVSAHWAYEFALGALAADMPTVVHLQDWGPAWFRYAPAHARAHFAVRGVMTIDSVRRSGGLSAVSPYLASRARRWAHGPIPVVPNPVLEDTILPERRTRVPDRCAVVAINNGFTPYKNVHTLLEAFPEIRTRLPHATLRLIGREMEAGGPAWRWASLRGLTAGVDFTGHIPEEDVDAALDASDVLVHASLMEGCPMVMIDAMSRSVPVVGGRTSGGVPWVLDGGRSGLLVDVRSPSSIASAVTELLQDDDQWHRFAAAGLESVRRRFSATTVVGQYEALLADAPATRGRRRGARRAT